jgi:hypothetical protein
LGASTPALSHLEIPKQSLTGVLRSTLSKLLSADCDPGGRRTVGAIDQLADLTHVQEELAPALDASLSRNIEQGTPLDPPEVETRVQAHVASSDQIAAASRD